MSAELDALTLARITLCDILHGRVLRGHAREALASALWCDAMNVPGASGLLDAAAHWEWMASISEQGKVGWGQRLNRCGSPEDG